jgi:hypothetical protein
MYVAKAVLLESKGSAKGLTKDSWPFPAQFSLRNDFGSARFILTHIVYAKYKLWLSQ